MKEEKNHPAGFSLIEFIVVLVVAGILAVMATAYFGSAITQSSVPIGRLKDASNLQKVMENMVTDYKRLNALNIRYKWQSNVDYLAGAVVVPTEDGIQDPSYNGNFYTSTSGGTSGSTEPTWPTSGTVSDGSVIWKTGGVIWTESGTPDETIVWRPGHTYSVNDVMVPYISNGHYYRCIGAGTSMSEVPESWRSEKSYSVGNTVVSSLFNGRYYRCTVGGDSGTSEPSWPSTNGGTVIDNEVTWQEVPDGGAGGTLRWSEVGTVLARSDMTSVSGYEAVLDDNLMNHLTTQSERYGTGYTVQEAKFIKFNSSTGVEEDAGSGDEKNLLKISIQSEASSETLTQIFTIR